MKTDDLAAEVAAYPHGRVPRKLRRRQVLAQARDLFVERGYHGASMDELARRVGVSKPVVYGLVGSKEELFREVMAIAGQDLAERVAAAVAAEPEIPRKLHVGILAFLRFVEQRREGWASLLSMEAGPATTQVAEIRRRQVLLVAGLIVEGIGRESATPDPRVVEALSHAINGAVESVSLWWLGHRDFSAEAVAELLTQLFTPGLLSLAQARDGQEPEPT